ncbi:MAG: tetratricopeptide repeat protein [Bacteroidaceae bacterium]|nr:tetratricopeptide repeat protein [Bacteroidaceae bacterium]
MCNRAKKIVIPFLTAIVIAALTGGCASKKNTASARFFHSFNARYNTYFNGSEAFKEGYEAQEKANKDNYMELIPLYMVGNKATQKAGTTNFNKAIEKAEKAIKRHSIKRKPQWTKNRKKTAKEKAYYARQEYNPFIWRAWLLLGQSQFHKGEFNEAAATFSYMERLYINQPDIIALARIWKARCYTELGWLYEADDAIVKTLRDTVPKRFHGELSSTLSDYYIRSSQYEQAVAQLRKAIKKEGHTLQKARENYLLGQLLLSLGRKQEAFKAFRKTTALNPPYELAFNARIKMAEASTGTSNQIIRRLTAMSKSEKNKDLLDQVYFAIGNVYLNRHDTAQAIKNYETGIEKSTKGGVSKSILALQLAEIYWNKWDYINSDRCYQIALSAIDKEHAKYSEAKERSEMLNELTPHLKSINLQDSLRALARMSEAERLKVIDKIIEQVKKDEEKAKREAEKQEANSIGNNLPIQNTNLPKPTATLQSRTAWYFYNPQLVQTGKEQFRKQWGERKLEDNWRRSNKTLISLESDFPNEEEGELQNDSTEALAANANKAAADSASNDNKSRAYYLKDIPLTEEAMAQSTATLSDALFNSGVLLKDKVENFVMANKMFSRLFALNPDYGKNDEALFYTYQLNARQGRLTDADRNKEQLISQYPDSKFAKNLADPDFAMKSAFGRHIEDSLYTTAYDAYYNGNYASTLSLCAQAAKDYPDGANRARFIFLEGVSKLQQGNKDGFVEAMRKIATDYPSSDLGSIAGYTVKGLQEGRRIAGSSFNSSSIWEMRQSDSLGNDSTGNANNFTADTNVEYAFVIAYEKGTVNEGQLLYDVANYNFSNFMVRNFDLRTENIGAIGEIIIGGFLNYNEACEYQKRLFADHKMVTALQNIKTIIISEENLARIGRQFSFADYAEFFDKNFTTVAPAAIELDDAEPVVVDDEE